MRLGFDFLYTAKLLWWLKRQNLLRVVMTLPRTPGGVENLYEISRRGWKKLAYLLGTPVSLARQLHAASYLLYGSGSVEELFQGHFVDLVNRPFSCMSPVTDDVGTLLIGFDPGFGECEIPWGSMLDRSPQGLAFVRTVKRVEHLQRLGYVPKAINPVFFVSNATYRGSSEPMILFDLVLRRCKELIEERDDLTENTDLHEHRLWGEKLRNTVLKGMNDSLKQKNAELEERLGKVADEAHYKDLKQQNEIMRLRNSLLNNIKCFTVLCQELDKINIPTLSATLIKIFVRNALLGIVVLDYFASSSNYQ
jgi:hypothetical protein